MVVAACENQNDKCAMWASRGECQNSPSYMESYCKRACGLCGTGQYFTNLDRKKNEQYHLNRKKFECCFTTTETVGLLGTGAQDGNLDFHTAPELWQKKC